jgi:hypothetical protein
MKNSINLQLHDENLTVSQLIEKSQKKLEKESILTHSYLDYDGVEISGATRASMLFRLDKFKISLNRGEKVYTCYNFNYLANQRLNQSPEAIPNEFYEKVERDIRFNKIPFHLSYIVNRNSNAFKNFFNKGNAIVNNNINNNNKNNYLTFKEIFDNILNNKYFPLQTFHLKNEVEKDRRVWKALNLFFYLTVTQTVVMNLCVFVFFNWDIMEPITQCFTYLNLICGYYYWAYSNGGDYEMSSMVAWMKSRNIFFRSLHQAYAEKAEIENFVEKRREE